MPLSDDGTYTPVLRTVTKQVEEWLSDDIDWAAASAAVAAEQDKGEPAHLADCYRWLRLLFQGLAAGKTMYASHYGGCPRIWHKVVGVGTAVHWPHWKPRPAVAVEGTLGVEWYDWDTLTDAK